MNGAEHLVEVQVGAADRGGRDPDDRVGRVLDGGSGTSSTRTSRLPCQVSAFKLVFLQVPRVGRECRVRTLAAPWPKLHERRPGGGRADAQAPRRGRDPAARLRRLPGSRRTPSGWSPRRSSPATAASTPPRLRQRGGRRAGARGRGHPPRRALRHDQAVERRPGVRHRPAAFDGSLERLGPRRRRPLPDPLAGPGRGPLRRDLAGVREAPRRGRVARDRRLQLPGRRTCERLLEPRPARPGPEPDRAAPAPAAGRAARVQRRARHRHRGLEPARAGDGARRAGARRRSPRRTAGPRPRSCSAGTSSSATSSSRSR